MADVLVRVVAPHFVAGIVFRAGRVVEAAPILRWTLGRTGPELARAFAARGWQAKRV